MIFNEHSRLEGRHSFLSPSQYHWINYDEQKLRAKFASWKAAVRGTDLHRFAQEAIRLRLKLSKANPTISMYVRDAIDYQMETEQPLFYSDNCFGTADAISFRRNTLRIHDLKTGIIPAKMNQLYVYAAIFCLEYAVSPFDIRTELRIYQSGEVKVEEADPNFIYQIMEKIVYLDDLTDQLKEGEL